MSRNAWILIALRNALVVLGGYLVARNCAALLEVFLPQSASWNGTPQIVLGTLLWSLPMLLTFAATSVLVCVVLESGRKFAWALVLGAIHPAEVTLWSFLLERGAGWPGWAGLWLHVAPIVGALVGFAVAKAWFGPSRLAAHANAQGGS